MRNLKRALSLLLSSTMVLGMVVMGGSAAGYQDVDASNDNQEAIEVLQAVGIMSGVDDAGNFNPDGSVTRNEMAVVMAHLLNLDYDYYRGVYTFSDVPEWAAPYVAACVAEGVTAGIGNGLYGGDQKITAAQASLMVMKALGYFQNQEDFGDDWQIATIRQASYINLFDKVNSNADSALTRGQVAQLVLNGLKSNMVDFTGDKGVQIGDVTVGYHAEYTDRTNAAVKYNSIDTGKTDIAGDNQYYIQLGEELYNGDLKLKSTTDEFGRPSRYWEYNGNEIGTYVKNELLRKEYTTEVTGKDLYDLLGKATIEDKDYDKYIYVDGETEKAVLGDAYFTAGNLVRGNTEAVGETGNGVLTQVYVDTQNKEITIAIINTYLAQASRDYDSKKEEASLTVWGIKDAGKDQYVKSTSSSQKVTFKATNEDFDVEDVKADDLFLVTVANGELQSIVDPKILADSTITSFKKEQGNLTTDGTTYSFADAACYDGVALETYTSEDDVTINLKDTTYNVVLDAYGYVIGVEEIDPATNYVFVTGYDGNYSNLVNKTADVGAIFLDGTMKTIKVNVDKSDSEIFGTNDVNTTTAVSNNAAQGTITEDSSDTELAYNDAIINRWCTYTVNDEGVYTLKVAANQSAENAGAKSQTSETAASSYTIDQKHITRAKAGGGYVVGNDDSVYLNVSLKKINIPGSKQAYVINDVESATVGVKNVSLEVKDRTELEADGTTAITPSVSNLTPYNEIYTVYDSDNYIIGCVTIGENQGVSSAYAYASSGSVTSESYDSETKEYTWAREVVINGELTTIRYVGDTIDEIDTTSMKQGEWYKLSLKADGTVKSSTRLNTNAYFNADSGSSSDDEYINSVADVEYSFDGYNGNTMLLWDARTNMNSSNSSHSTNVNYLHFENGSLYTIAGVTTGFSVSPDVKVVLINADGSDTPKEFNSVEDGYVGYDGLKDAINDLNGNFTGDLSAVFENGLATSIVINCTAKDTGFDPGETTPQADKYSSVVDQSITTANGLSLLDMSGSNYSISSTFAINMNVLDGANLQTQVKELLAYKKYTNIGNMTYSSTDSKYHITATNPDGIVVDLTLAAPSTANTVYKVKVDGTDKYMLANTQRSALKVGSETYLKENGTYVLADTTTIKNGAEYITGYYKVTGVADQTSAAVIPTTTTGQYTYTSTVDSKGEKVGDDFYVKADATITVTVTWAAGTITSTKDTVTVTCTNSSASTGTALDFNAGSFTAPQTQSATITTFTNDATISISGANN